VPDPSSKVTVAAVVAAIACCGVPLLVAAGLLTTAGVALRNLAIIGGGVGLLAWLVLRAARHAQRQNPEARTSRPPPDRSGPQP
jgi:hypothetical protein